MIIAHDFVVNSEGNGRREEGGEGEGMYSTVRRELHSTKD